MGLNNELFMLIKSMDKNEKGYFRKFSKLHSNKGEGNYLKLFDCIAGMDRYDARRIRATFTGQKFLAQLGVTENYLKNLIIKSLRNYYDHGDTDIQLMNDLTEIKVLGMKQLYGSALNRITRLKKICGEKEKFLYSLILLQERYRILWNGGRHREMISAGAARLEEQHRCLRMLDNLDEYLYLQCMIFGTQQIEGLEQGGYEKEIERYLKNPLLAKEEMALGFSAKCIRLDILGRCYRKLGDKQKALENSLAEESLFDANPGQIKNFPWIYIATLDELASRYAINRLYNEADKYVAKTEAILADKAVRINANERFQAHTDALRCKLSIRARTGKFKQGIEISNQLYPLFANNPVRKNAQAPTTFFTAICYLGVDKPGEALKLINPWLNDPANVRQDVLLGLHFLNLIIHFELGNHAIIKRLLKVYHNFIVRYRFPTTGWLDFSRNFNGIVKAKTASRPKEFKNHLQKLLDGTNNDKYDFLDGPFMKWWLEKKLQGK